MNSLETKTQENEQKSPLIRQYEKPSIRRHAVVMTMAPQGCKMGHGLFPFVTKSQETSYLAAEYAYRRK